MRLAFSLHAANEELRSRLMPINRRVGLAELASAIRTYLSRTKRRVTIQYVLLAGVNDSATHADELAALLSTVGPASRLHVNLIPYNENGLGLPGGGLFRSAQMDDVYAFQRKMWDQGTLCTVRETRGDDDRMACGQLATRVTRKLSSKAQLATSS